VDGVEIALSADMAGSYRLLVARFSPTLESKWTSFDGKALRESSLTIAGFLDTLPSASEITRGETGGNIEGYGPGSPRGNLSFNSTGLRGQNNGFQFDRMDNNDSWLRGPVLVPGMAALVAHALQPWRHPTPTVCSNSGPGCRCPRTTQLPTHCPQLNIFEGACATLCSEATPVFERACATIGRAG
jgi:hypothetical protein